MRPLLALALLSLVACSAEVTPVDTHEQPDTSAAAGDAGACTETVHACEIVATDEEQGTMSVRCDAAPEGTVTCEATGPGIYRCELGCIRTPARDCDLCDPSRAYQCATGHVPNDCEALADGRACCL